MLGVVDVFQCMLEKVFERFDIAREEAHGFFRSFASPRKLLRHVQVPDSKPGCAIVRCCTRESQTPEELRNQSSSVSLSPCSLRKASQMHEIIYLIGLVVVVMFVLSLLGLR